MQEPRAKSQEHKADVRSYLGSTQYVVRYFRTYFYFRGRGRGKVRYDGIIIIMGFSFGIRRSPRS